MLLKLTIYLYFQLLIVLLLLYSCANVVAPSGGPKDTTPPEIVKSIPENYSVNFNEQKINISFDEYIQLKNINQQLLISPPLKEKPEIKIKGKNIIIDIKNKLHDNTTYAFNFGDAIVDVNEGNILKNYQFVFSTGDYLDSLLINGSVLNAFNLKPEENVFVMLYENLNDSAPITDTALYVSRTNKTGSFSINNIKTGEYLIFALKDVNNNYLFDQPNEEVAFLDSLIIPEAKIIITTDTILTDGKAGNNDSIVTRSNTVFSPKDLQLFLFMEDTKRQYISKSLREEKGRCTFIFSRPLKDSLLIAPLNFTPQNNWNIIEKTTIREITSDTITCWITDTLISNMDTLIFQLNYQKKDSLGNYQLFSDTVSLSFIPQQISKKKKKQTFKTDTLILKFNIQNSSVFALNKNISIECSHPVFSRDVACWNEVEIPTSRGNVSTKKIELYQIQDTLEISKEFKFFKDSVHLRKFFISYPFEENTSYKLLIYPGAFKDIFGFSNDTLLLNFVIQKADYYGNLYVDFSNISTNTIVQLMDLKENIIIEKSINSDSIRVEFTYLKPQQYKLKLIFDKNNNTKWDTGKYIAPPKSSPKGRTSFQPEKVLYYPEEINVRSNWDVELSWDVEK